MTLQSLRGLGLGGVSWKPDGLHWFFDHQYIFYVLLMLFMKLEEERKQDQKSEILKKFVGWQQADRRSCHPVEFNTENGHVEF